ncbi:MAG: flagellar basal body rod protein FlgC [Nitrospirota bacterium]
MDSFGIFRVSGSALEAQRQRMNVIASNMANAHSTKTDEGGPYRRKDVIFTTDPMTASGPGLEGVKVSNVVVDSTPPRMIYDPSHPDANASGLVAMPNVNVIEEMVNMMMASRAYEASASAFSISKASFMKTLELLK